MSVPLTNWEVQIKQLRIIRRTRTKQPFPVLGNKLYVTSEAVWLTLPCLLSSSEDLRLLLEQWPAYLNSEGQEATLPADLGLL